MKRVIALVLIVAAMAAGSVSGIAMLRPHSRPAEENGEFNSILEDIKQITITPHIAGSPENYKVRDMLAERAEAMGLAVEVMPFEWKGNNNAVRILHNLLVKVPGTSPRGAVMFVSHYDHVSGAPGAADDALAVASMVQLMEKLSKQPPQNDVYFLYTDGEDQGLLGAADFVNTQPGYAKEVDVLFNLEARGNRGAMLMFETSGRDYELVKRFKDNVPQPVTLSVATAIYSMMPNSTDYSEFKKAGYHGLNFAMIEGDETYHQPSDTLENLNKDTAWQYYQTVMALGEYFGNEDLRGVGITQEAQYFPLPLIGIVVVPGWLCWILGFFPLVLSVLLIVVTIRNRQMESKQKLLRSAGLLIMGIVPAAATVLFFAGSYMLWLPAALFLLADLIMGNGGGLRVWAGIIMLGAAVYVSAVLYGSLTFLVQIAMKLWFATAILVILPLIPAAVYVRKGLCQADIA